MIPKATSILFSDPRQKIKRCFSLLGNGFLYNLLPGIYLTIVLIGLGINKQLQVIVEKINQNWLQYYRIGIELPKNSLQILQVCCLIYDFFKLMLTVFSNSAPNSVNKSLGFAQALTNEGFKFLSGNRDINLVFYLMVMLLPVKHSSIFREDSCKQNSIWLCVISGTKMILALLEEIIAFHMSFTQIDI